MVDRTTTIPTTTAAHGCSLGAAAPEAGSTVRSAFHFTFALSLYAWVAAKLYVPARTFAVTRTGNAVVVRSTSLPPVHVTEEPLTSAFQPGGEEAESIEIPGGASTERETVSLGGRSFG